MSQPIADVNKVIIVNSADLPVCCPPKAQSVWNEHPRVYLPLEETQQATCPYCGNHFELCQ